MTSDRIKALVEAARRMVNERSRCGCSPYRADRCDDCLIRDALAALDASPVVTPEEYVRAGVNAVLDWHRNSPMEDKVTFFTCGTVNDCDFTSIARAVEDKKNG